MQHDVLGESALEELYEKVILPQFGIVDTISWKNHFRIGPDNHAHLFACGGARFVLVYDDYPTTDVDSLKKEFSGASIMQVALDRSGNNVTVDESITLGRDDYILRFGPGSLPHKWVYNVTGYFQLFRIE